jgi:hypothetical protein
MSLDQRAEALALLDALADRDLPAVIEYMRSLGDERARPGADALEALLEEPGLKRPA